MSPDPSALLAPDSFKGTLSASEVVDALAGSFGAAGWEVDRAALGDGGEGTAEALRSALGGGWIDAAAHDPLGRPIEARFLLSPEGRTAVVEAAAASGLALIPESDRDPEQASTVGTGDLMAAAVAHGASRILLCVGGTASTDGGLGALAAIEAGGGLRGAQVTCLCDVRTAWERAAEVFAPQKGADPAAVRRLAERLEGIAGDLPNDPRGVRMGGAGGGLAGGLWAALEGTQMAAGAGFVLEAVGFDRRAKAADLVVSGEGRLDRTTLEGKVVSEVARRCSSLDVPLHLVAGEDASDAAVHEELGLASVQVAGDRERLAAAATVIAASGN